MSTIDFQKIVTEEGSRGILTVKDKTFLGQPV